MDQDVTWYGARPRPRRLYVRWGPSTLHQKGSGAPSPIFGPFLLWPNGWMHQDATWYGSMPQPRGLCVRCRPSPPSPPRGWSPLPNFRPIFYCGQTAGCIKMPLGMEVGLSPGDLVLDEDPAPSLITKKTAAEPPNFRPMSIVAKRLHGSRCNSVRK